jgi:hypothetical protein
MVLQNGGTELPFLWRTTINSTRDIFHSLANLKLPMKIMINQDVNALLVLSKSAASKVIILLYIT